MTLNQLSSKEYLPFYGSYIRKLDDVGFLEGLESGLDQAIAFFESIPEDKLEYRYAQGKWTIKDVIQHLIDGERIFACRMLRIAR
jgi:CRISPR/Cas system CMR-associated protein Cmr5 small subunit